MTIRIPRVNPITRIEDTTLLVDSIKVRQISFRLLPPTTPATTIIAKNNEDISSIYHPSMLVP